MNSTRWLWVVVVVLATLLVWPHVSQRFGWARHAEYSVRQTVALAVMPGQQLTSDQPVHPDAAKWQQDTEHLRQVVEAGHETSVEWALASTWQEVRLARPAVLIEFGPQGWKPKNDQLENWRLPVRADFVHAVTQSKIPALPESLVPVSQMNKDGVSWTYGWVWLSCLDVQNSISPAKWNETNNRTPVEEGEVVLYRANCILKPGQSSETLVYALPDLSTAERRECEFFSRVRQLTRMEGVVIDVDLGGAEGGGGSAINSPPNHEVLPETRGAVTVTVKLMVPSPVEEVPIEFVFCKKVTGR